MKAVRYIINELKSIGWEEYAVFVLAIVSSYLWIIGITLLWW